MQAGGPCDLGPERTAQGRGPGCQAEPCEHGVVRMPLFDERQRDHREHLGQRKTRMQGPNRSSHCPRALCGRTQDGHWVIEELLGHGGGLDIGRTAQPDDHAAEIAPLARDRGHEQAPEAPGEREDNPVAPCDQARDVRVQTDESPGRRTIGGHRLTPGRRTRSPQTGGLRGEARGPSLRRAPASGNPGPEG